MNGVIKQDDISTSLMSEVREIWNLVYPVSIAHATISETQYFIESKLERNHYLVLQGQKLIGWSFTFLRDNQTWFSLLVHPDYQRKGIGGQLINAMKQNNFELCGWVVDKSHDKLENGKPYAIPLDFYFKHDFNLRENSRFDTEKLNSVKIEWIKILI